MDILSDHSQIIRVSWKCVVHSAGNGQATVQAPRHPGTQAPRLQGAQASRNLGPGGSFCLFVCSNPVRHPSLPAKPPSTAATITDFSFS